jgi:uncharacterized protein
LGAGEGRFHALIQTIFEPEAARVQDLTYSVADLLGRPGEYREFSVAPVLSGVGTALARLSEKPIRADLRAESVVEGILVTGPLAGALDLKCARCLRGFEGDLTLDLLELFVLPGQERPKDEDAYSISGKEIRLEPMLRDAVTLALPLNPLCREDCAGLCAQCGRDLNDGACDCRTDDVDPRWADLASIKDKLSD